MPSRPRSLFVDQLYGVDAVETRRRLALAKAAVKAAAIEGGNDRALLATLSRVEADLLCAARAAVVDLAEALAFYEDGRTAPPEPVPEPKPPPDPPVAPVRYARLPRLPRTSP
ncbi:MULTISPECIES: hypothetical protein [unclassified Methylobacterium]|jgi:hypothetical protein|uniref:hypothetical protein n=1 Tax=unclassified Methylobacterium TaxID=2615210 RepID=UPI0006ADC452|nr:hypothetical protein [Methylobacterium sp. yr596]KOX59683.1 hypothetical protein ADL19_04390 [Streptomyces purpurogeneiscleroticus]SFF59955.1 hypothetical protein SAMN04487844_13053 [Methylobacterium sp. yr596]